MSDSILLIPHIRVHNANALSSPFTIGFPAMTAWLGAVHALQRKLNAEGFKLLFDAVGVISHQFDLQTYKGPGDFVSSIIGTANPVDKDGSRSAFIEEARCHVDVSLVIQHDNIAKSEEEELIEKISHCLNANMKLAGGDILDFQPPKFYRDFKKVRPKLMPGYAITERRDLMREAMEQGQDAMDAMLDYLAIHHSCQQQEQSGQTIVTWQSQRKRTGNEDQRGWIVPIATGFHGISELGQAKNQRDPETPHRFAESVVTLGEFKMPYKMNRLEELLWHYHVEPENDLYLCQQTDSQTLAEEDGF